MNAGPTLAKTVWANADFDQMSWHDNEVHAIALESALPEPGRLLLDIDYIVQGVLSQPPSRLVSFWICPATLVFDPAWDLTTDIDLRGWAFSLSLLSVQRSDPDERGNFDWTLEGDQFTIELGAPGFTQYLRGPPVYTPLSAHRRGARRIQLRPPGLYPVTVGRTARDDPARRADRLPCSGASRRCSSAGRAAVL